MAGAGGRDGQQQQLQGKKHGKLKRKVKMNVEGEKQKKKKIFEEHVKSEKIISSQSLLGECTSSQDCGFTFYRESH